MRAKSTMNEVALEAGVSLGTVSKVFNGNSTVSPDRRERVIAAADRLNYQRNRIAASLRSRQTRTIGIVVPDILNTFFGVLVEKLENLASASGYTVMIVTAGEDAQRSCERARMLKENQVDGMIVIPSLDGSERLMSEIGSGMPCVIADRISAKNPFPSVATDNFDAAYQGAKYLLSLGHRRIVFAANIPRLWNTQERIDGFEQAIRERKIRPNVRIVGMTVEEACKSIESLLNDKDRPTAIFTSNNLVTLGAISAMCDCNIEVPNQMSFLAFDDFEWLKLLRPAVSAVAQPIDQIAAEAWRLMSHQLNGRRILNPHVRSAGQLIVRQSTGKAPYPIGKTKSA
jgi:LacI family transcriptional regulator